jgi:hypothetical protein
VVQREHPRLEREARGVRAEGEDVPVLEDDPLLEVALGLDDVAPDAALADVRAALPGDLSGNGAGPGSGDPATVKEPLIRLKQLLEADDGEAADFIVDAKPRLAGVLTSTEIRTLSDRVGNFDFDAALKCLSGIASRLSLDLEAK